MSYLNIHKSCSGRDDFLQITNMLVCLHTKVYRASDLDKIHPSFTYIYIPRLLYLIYSSTHLE